MSYRRFVNQAVVGVAVAVLASAVQADIVFVYPGESIQAAISICADGDEIIVHPGTYVQTIDFLGKAITLRSTAPTDPDVVAATIIDGGGAYHVVQCVNGEGPDTILEGFTITGGNANGSYPNGHGGGMYNSQTSPTVTNCTFSDNSASDCGGGMFNSSSSPTVLGCTFSDNSAERDGGGMCNSGGGPTVTNCTFTGNSVGGLGTGGGMCNDSSSPTVTDCTFTGNSGGWGGGGMFNFEDSYPTVDNCTFSGNMTGDWGGGMCSDDGAGATVTNCTFSGNEAGQRGGGLYADHTSVSCAITNCRFSGNAALEGGGMYTESLSNQAVTDSVFCDNSPDHIKGPVELDGQIAMSTFCPVPACSGDADGDGEVTVLDFLALLANWGPCP
jgi:parallel beta-helix repeat protein/predicted outer membrane repeat protein